MPGGDHPVLPDEDAFTFPGGWRRQLISWRGRLAGSEFTPSPAAAPSMPKNKAFVKMLDHPDSDPELVAAARQALHDWGRATPLGAAVLLLAVMRLDGMKLSQLQAEFDCWVASRGLPFAANMAAELPDLLMTSNFFNGFMLYRRSRNPVRVSHWADEQWEQFALRLRAHLTHASDREYAEACAAVAGHRERGLDARVVTSFLFPTRTDWVDADCEAVAASPHPVLALLLWRSAGSATQLQQLAECLNPWQGVRRLEVFLTGVAAVGPASAPVLLSWLDEPSGSRADERLLAVLSRIPTDEAMRGLIARLDRPPVRAAFLKAQKRFPVRALRMLAEAAVDETSAGQAAPLLRAQVSGRPELVAAALPGLPPPAATYLEQIAADARRGHHTDVPFAPAESLPPVLVDPPWSRKRSPEKATFTTGLTPSSGTELVWLPGERESWRTSRYSTAIKIRENWQQYAAQYHAGTLPPYRESDLFLEAPDDIPRDWVTSWRPRRIYYPEQWLPPFVARYEQDALPTLWYVAKKQPVPAAPFLVPFANVEIAIQMADWLSRTQTVRSTALVWLRRHPAFAARALIPAALGKPGRRRSAAEQALQALAATHRGELLTAAEGYGETVLAGVESLLTADPVGAPPTRIPHVPAWADPVLLPPVLLRGRASALPPEAVRHLCSMLAMSTMDEQYAGVPLVKEACDPVSLAEFGWALFEQWRSMGMPSKERWAFTALAGLGDDQTVLRIDPLIRAWPGQGKHPHAVTGLDILAAIGTETALQRLSDIAQKARFKALRKQAEQKIVEVAATRGLTAAQLEDRLVPDLGLDERGSLTLDYGRRRFTVGFDEQLKPYVLDETGKPRKTLPKPGSLDDTQLAPAAYQRFSLLKKEVRALAANQITRLEQAMANQRRWSFAEFRQLLVEHPLVWHIVRRLVWAQFDDDMVTAFRVAEDRSLADVDDQVLVLDDDTTVGVAHPIHLGSTVSAWSEMFADYELLQPFPQLSREVHTLPEPERQAETLDRLQGVKVPTGKLLGLERRGWRRSTPQDGGVQPWLLRPLPDGGAVVVNLDPGIAIGLPDMFPEQQLTEIWIDDHGVGNWHRQGGRRFSELSPVTASELLRDLTEVTA